MQFGLTQKVIDQIRAVFLTVPKVTRVRIFGSRALGKQNEGSDIDLAIEGSGIELNDLLEIKVKLKKHPLPYRFDLVDFGRLVDPSLREHIGRVGVMIFERVETRNG